jgi:streptomycin 6-kinase
MAGILVSESLGWVRNAPGGAEWLERLPAIVSECVERWGLTLEAPFDGNASLVIPAGDAVLKVNFPDADEHEPDALRLWDGHGAVKLLAEDRGRRALLVERCDPGTSLLELGDDTAADVVTGLLPTLWKPAPSEFRTLAAVATRWVEELPAHWESFERPFERRILDAAVDALRELGPTQGPLVVANEDLHAGNVLASRREPWLVIDPKPLAAEREFTPVAMIRDRKDEVLAGPHPLRRLRHRLDRFAADLELDRERVRGWTLAHTVGWGFEPGGFLTAHADVARLLLEA